MPGRKPPNVLFIMADQSCVLSSCFVQAPVCVPSRQTYFSGRYPHSHRNRVNYTPLPPGTTLMQELLRRRGYTTGFVGKLHYWPPTREHALTTGFDMGLLHDGGPCDQYSDYLAWLSDENPELAADYRRCRTGHPNPFIAEISDDAHETTWCGRETRGMLRRLASGERPWFLFSSYWKPHSSFEVPAPWASMYDSAEIEVPEWVGDEYLAALPAPLRALAFRGDADYYRENRELWIWMYRAYYAAVSQIDREVGRTLRRLDELRLADDTVVVFCSDHGDLLLEHGMVDKNVFFDSAVHVPLMIRYPGIVEPGTLSDLVETTDVLPTLFELCGLEPPGQAQGRSFAGAMTSRTGSPYVPRDRVYCENIIPEVMTGGGVDACFQRGRGVMGIEHPDAKMVRTHRWKYVYYPNGGRELYDIEADPGEMVNLADAPSHSDVTAELQESILHWMITADEGDQIAERWLLD